MLITLQDETMRDSSKEQISGERWKERKKGERGGEEGKRWTYPVSVFAATLFIFRQLYCPKRYHQREDIVQHVERVRNQSKGMNRITDGDFEKEEYCIDHKEWYYSCRPWERHGWSMALVVCLFVCLFDFSPWVVGDDQVIEQITRKSFLRWFEVEQTDQTTVLKE